MRIWTASPRSIKKFEDPIEFIKKIIIPNNIDFIVDVRGYKNAHGVAMTPEKIKLSAENKGIKFLYIGDYIGQSDKIFNKSKFYKNIDDEIHQKMIHAIIEACKKYNVCIIGSAKKYRDDIRYELAHYIKELVQKEENDTLYIMHIGD